MGAARPVFGRNIGPFNVNARNRRTDIFATLDGPRNDLKIVKQALIGECNKSRKVVGRAGGIQGRDDITYGFLA